MYWAFIAWEWAGEGWAWYRFEPQETTTITRWQIPILGWVHPYEICL
jgi:hypothetical protein